MSLKHIFYIFLLLAILTTSLGFVCASENVSDSTSDIYGIYQDQISYDDLDLTNEKNHPVSAYQEEDSGNIETSNDLLGISNNKNNHVVNVYREEDSRSNITEDDLLTKSNNEESLQSVKTLNDNYFADLRTAIDNAKDGDIIDLQGKTIITAKNGNPKFQTNKNLTFINGVFDAGNSPSIPIQNRNFIQNCYFENITFRNYDAACMYPNFFVNCVLKHVCFENFTLAVAGFVIRNSDLYDVNFTNCHSLMGEDSSDYEYAAMAVTYNSVLDHCNFFNCTTNRHSGAICVAGENGNRVDILNSNFINCSAGIGGAIYVHGNNAINENYHSNIINCTFIGNTATERGGAIGSSQNYLIVENCVFENNYAKQGAAYMLAGIDHGLDGITEGHYNTMINCSFRNNVGTEEGGAVHITGDNNRAINCTFYDNYATNGNGSAIHIYGENASIINSEFYNHKCSRGTVYIIGNNSLIDNSVFENNTATRGGAGVYVDGDNTLVNNSLFKSNNATVHGGALHSHGNNLRVLNSNFTSNIAIASIENLDQGLGGAIYINGYNSNISNSYFRNNVARNGSAIYNRGENLRIGEDTFFENQAWSYLLTNMPNHRRIYYDPEKNTTIDITFKGGDNIINAIYNDGSPNMISFYNVTYESSLDKNKNTGTKVISPVNGVENSNNGKLLYQDPREDLQNITIIVTHIESGKVVINQTGQTGILGNFSVSKKGLLPGNYSVTVSHYEDGLYKFITNTSYFEIIPQVDLEIKKIVSDKTPKYGDEITWTISVFNHGPSNATNVYVKDVLPAGVSYISDDSNGKYKNNIWDIGDLNHNDEAILVIKTRVDIVETTVTNVALVNSSTHDYNESNNIDNDTIEVVPTCDLEIIKVVSDSNPKYLDQVVWTITVLNHGPSNATGVYVEDLLPAGLSYVSDDSNGAYVNGKWVIGDLAKHGDAVINIKTIVMLSNAQITNVALVNSTTPDYDETNNKDNDTINVGPICDVVIEKSVDNHNPKKGDIITWTVTVTNKGPDAAKNIIMRDVIPAGLIFVDSDGNYANNVWNIGDLAKGLTAVLKIRTKVDVTDAVITNVANVTTDTPESDLTNNNDSATVDVGHEADLAVVKVVSNSNPKKGDIINWTIIVTNNGPDRAVDVFVSDVLPSGLIYVSDDSNGKFKNNIWDIGNLENKASVTLVITTKVDASNTNVTNIAVVKSDTHDPDDSNNEDNDTVEVEPISDLVIEKSVDNHNPKKGDIITWTVTVTNKGPDAAKNIIMRDVIPAGLIFVDSDGNYANNAWNIGDLANGEGAVLKIWTKVDVTDAVITNVANVTTDTPESDLTNNNDSATVDVGHEADLAVVKVVSNPAPKYGDEITWTITVTNNGPDRAIDVFVSDILPSGLIYVSDDSNGKFKNNVWDIGNLENKASVTLVITTKVDASNTNITNIAVVKSDTHDPDDSNNEDNDTVEIPPRADIEVTKVVSNPKPHNGDEITWTVSVFNHGPQDAINVIVKDTLPAGLIYISDDGEGSYNSRTGLWYVGDLHNGRGLVLNILTRVAVTDTNITNIARATSDTYDFNESNNEDNDTIEINPISDLIIEKSVDNHNPKKGDIITWTISVTNKGPDAAKNIIMRDVIPAGLIFVDSDGNYANNIWNIGDLAKGLTAVLKIRTKVDVTNAVITNVANVTTDTPESDLTNNNDSATVYIGREADLAVVKVVSNPAPKYGDEITWTITVTNNGPDRAIDVFVSDVLPSGLIYVSDDSNGKFKNNVWDIGNLENKASVTLVITTKVDASNTNVTNIAVVKSDTHDPDDSNNEDNDTVEIPPRADVEITKTVSNNISSFGDEITWTVSVFNHGPDVAINVIVEDTLPEGLIYVSDDSDGKYNSNNGQWIVGDLQVGRGSIINIITRINALNTNIINVASVNSTTFDPNESNNKANDSTEVLPLADLEIIKTVMNSTSKKGDTITWTITVTNNGPNSAKDVKVTDKLPTGLVFVSADGDYNKNTGVWIIGELANGESKSLAIKTIVDISNAQITNVAVVDSSTPDPNKQNNKGNDTTKVDPAADVKVVKTVSNPKPTVGDVITWTVVVANRGPDTAENVVVEEMLPEGLKLISAKGSKGSFNKGIWTVGSLNDGEIAALTLTTKVTVVGTIENIVVASTTTFDTNQNNNRDKEITISKAKPDPADLELTKVANKNKVKVGDLIVWTITVVNHGPDKAVGVRVSEMLNAGECELIDYKASKGMFYPYDGDWIIGDMAVGETVTLQITVKALYAGELVNYAYVVSDTPDPNPDNNEASATVVVEKNTDDKVDETPKNHQAPTMHATGNPIAMVLLALLAVVGVGLRRRN